MKNLALTAHITSDVSDLPLLRLLLSLGVVDVSLLTAEEARRIPPTCVNAASPR